MHLDSRMNTAVIGCYYGIKFIKETEDKILYVLKLVIHQM